MNTVLDDINKIKTIDKDSMFKILERFPEQCKEAIKLSKGLSIPREIRTGGKLSIKYVKPKNIVVAGMGGSAIGGTILKNWLKDRLTVPIEVCRSYHLPAYANDKTLVLVVSYSGNTEETLSAYFEALEKQCMILCITSGGLLHDFSKKLGVPIAELPSGYLPRFAIAYLFFPLVAYLQRLELIHSIEDEIQDTIEGVTKLRDEVKIDTPESLNISKKLATGLEDTIPLICGFDIYEGVALRMKTQFNENAKIQAKAEFFPELNHNETVGWTGLKNLLRNFSVVIIRDDYEELEIQTRIDVTRSLVFDKYSRKVFVVSAKGRCKLSRIFYAMYVGDFTSLYLAILYRVNPAPVGIIDEVKSRLINKIDTIKNWEKSLNKFLEG